MHRFPVSTPRLAAAGLAAAAVAAVRLSPWPSALLIRAVFARGARQVAGLMRPHAPATGITEHRGLRYAPASRGGGRLDLFVPRDAPGPAPLVVWIHGGAWLSGSRNDVEPYLRILASHGYAAAGVDYTIAPRGTYPQAVRELTEALAFLQDRAGELGLDPQRIVLAGDPAGAQLAAQLAVLATNPDYGRVTGLPPALAAADLRGVILHCGVYDLAALAGLRGVLGWGFKTALWAYTGNRDWSSTPAGAQMSVLDHVTARFPPALIAGGNGDSLTGSQSVPLAARLAALGTAVRTRFWPAGHSPALPHEYQFHLNRPEARQTLAETLAFLAEVCAVDIPAKSIRNKRDAGKTQTLKA
ncbi:alpha/beta hydrolase [Arthrobacter jiangjiafuii]|uniref:Alpha/beta hydrolase n=1 Tax=Arthrobacter jiangjiafuii TaxID=2817475 RepID=A0A975M6C9_9MICC|nr:alpha/beta hydrolase [Arthrobacter jiangjiafuii]MBP3043773.1 alpha/beta hydrolase [Arthrobacter jiangjiafuii]QWC10798.1 alpha/beta hydrolase [Arthrobacter jiangjiafuii]